MKTIFLPRGIATAFVLLGVIGQAGADGTPQTLPFSQNWTNTGLITANDDWSGVPGIEGFLGQDLTTGTGTNPQTLLGTSVVAGDLSALANQTTPNTVTAGDVAEFQIADPSIALQGSGTADAPYLLLHVNTNGQQNITVAYNLRDIDGSGDNAVQPVALQFRVGTSGNFTDVPTGFVADASTGPSIATLVTPVSAILPAAANNQAEVQIRVITANASGSDEWIGIDDIQVSGSPIVVVPTLSINDIGVTEGPTATTVTASFMVSLSSPAPVGGVSFDIATADGSGPNPATVADNDYVLKSLTGQTIASGSSNYTFDVVVNGDGVAEANETYLVNVTNVTAATIADGQGLGTITNDDASLPQLSIGDANIAEGNGGTTTLTFPVSLDAPAPATGVTFTINTGDGTATTAGNDYVAIVNGSGSIGSGNTSTTVDVTLNGDTGFEPNENFSVTLSAVANAAVADGQATGTINNDDALEIHDIQGDNLASPFITQAVVTNNNIVTGIGPQGFTLQAPDARADANPNTSEAVYVFTLSAPSVAVGDMVNVSGTAAEFNGLTEITFATITPVSTGNPLPTPVDFNASVPSPDPGTPTCSASGTNFECFEFMRVRIADGLVSTGNQRFGSPATETFAEVFVTANGRRGVREPGLLFPLVPTAGNLAAGQWDGNPEMFEVDADYFGAVAQDTPITAGTRFSATGVLGYDFGDYELWATEFNVTQAAVLPRPVRDSSGATDLRIGAFNMLRFCDITNDGAGADPCLAPTPSPAAFAAKVSRLSAYVKDVLKLPDVLGVEEVENLATLQALATQLATDSGVTYVARLDEGNDIGGIDVGYLVRTDRVSNITTTQLGKTLTWNDPTGSPTALLNDRPPLLLEATFTAGGGVPFAVMVVHPKSRSCVDKTGGATCVQADVDRNRLKRFEQGKYHAQQIQAYQLAHPGRLFAVVGDFNDYQFADGWTHMTGAMAGTYDDAANLLDYAGNTVVTPKLWNAVESLPLNEQYSFLFTENFGEFQGFNTRDVPTQQVLDHALLNVTAKSLFTGFDYGRADNDAPNEWERQCNLVPTPLPPLCPHPAIAVSDHDGFVFKLATDRIFADGFEANP